MSNILVFMSDNRPLATDKSLCNYNSFVAYINFVYSRYRGYRFVYYQPHMQGSSESDLFNCLDPNTGKKRHASWAKVLAAQIALTDQALDYAVYVDSDCIFTTTKRSLESFILKHADNYLTFLNNYPWHPQFPCAGFFVCKNCVETKLFLKEWFNYKNPSNDSIEWNRVLDLAEKTHQHRWNLGRFFEQDTLWLMLPRQGIGFDKEEIMFVPQNGQMLAHISRVVDSKMRLEIFRQYVEKMEPQHGKYEEIVKEISVQKFATDSVYA